MNFTDIAFYLGTDADADRDRQIDTERWLRPIPTGDKCPELCQLAEEYQDNLMPDKAFWQVKMDGIRCLYIDGTLWTRQGTPFYAASHALESLRALEKEYGQPMFFDGEYCEDGFEETLAAFNRGVGTGTIWLFDAMPLQNWLNLHQRQYPVTAYDRAVTLEFMASRCLSPYLGCLKPMDFGATWTTLREAAIHLWRQSFEGIVIKDADALYARDRVPTWLKLKQTLTLFIPVEDIVQVTERRTKQPMVGSFVVNHAGAIQRVGAGMNDAQRLAAWADRERLTGRAGTVTVECAGFYASGKMREARVISVNPDRKP